jgi:ADP-glucose pyrophosphorylase
LPNSTIEKNVKLTRVIVDTDVKVSKEKSKKIEEIRRKDKNAIVVVGKYKIQSSTEVED